jgi:hypothetical protein
MAFNKIMLPKTPQHRRDGIAGELTCSANRVSMRCQWLCIDGRRTSEAVKSTGAPERRKGAAYQVNSYRADQVALARFGRFGAARPTT